MTSKFPQFGVHWIDIARHLAGGPQPVHLLERPLLHGVDPKGSVFNVAEVARDGKYHVPLLDVFQDQQQWVFTDYGVYVRVPLYAYKTQQRALAAVWGLGIQVGLAAMWAFLSTHPGEKPQAVHVVLGNDCTDLAAGSEDAFRCYAGVAIQT